MIQLINSIKGDLVENITPPAKFHTLYNTPDSRFISLEMYGGLTIDIDGSGVKSIYPYFAASEEASNCDKSQFKNLVKSGDLIPLYGVDVEDPQRGYYDVLKSEAGYVIKTKRVGVWTPNVSFDVEVVGDSNGGYITYKIPNAFGLEGIGWGYYSSICTHFDFKNTPSLNGVGYWGDTENLNSDLFFRVNASTYPTPDSFKVWLKSVKDEFEILYKLYQKEDVDYSDTPAGIYLSKAGTQYPNTNFLSTYAYCVIRYLVYSSNSKESIVCYNKYDNCYLDYQDNGNITLNFDISPKVPYYDLIKEEQRLFYKDRYFVIKKINDRRKTVTTVTAELDLDDFKTGAKFEFEAVEQTLSNYLDDIVLGTEWSHKNANTVSKKHTIRLTNVDKLDRLLEAEEVWGCRFSFDNKNKVINVINVETIQPSGAYVMQDLNLTNLERKGDSSNFCTRLICRGAQIEEGSYVTFADINDGKDYVENFTYSDKVIEKTWADERYVNPQSLLDDAIEKLKELSTPVRTYSCSVIDLAKANPKEYGFLALNMYDVIYLLDSDTGLRLKYRIVNYVDYEDNKLNNTVTLSTLNYSLTGTITLIKKTLDYPGDIEISGKTLNEIKQDVEVNSSKISERYTKGQTDALVQSLITQSKDEIRTEVSEKYVSNSDYSQKISEIEQNVNGVSLSIKSNGYRNLIKNSVGLSYDYSEGQLVIPNWNYEGQVEITQCESISGSGYSLTSLSKTPAKMTQELKLVASKQYTIGGKVKSNLGISTLKIELVQLDDDTKRTTLVNQSGITDLELQDFQYTFNSPYRSCYLVITEENTLYSGTFITDFILVEGNSLISWTQSEQELYTDFVNVDSSGIQVGNNYTEMKSKMTTHSFEIYRGNEKRINVAPDGTRLQKTIIEDDLTVGSVKMLKRDEGVDFVVL